MMFNRNKIIREIADIYGVSYLEIFSHRRFKKPAQARFCIYLAFRYLGLSLYAISRIFKKDHTTIVYGIQFAEKDKFASDVAKQIYIKYVDQGFMDEEDKTKDEIISKNILDSLNAGETMDKIIKKYKLSKLDVLKRKIDFKLIPDYKNNKIKKFYFLLK